MPIRIVHTADNHIGIPYRQFSENIRRQLVSERFDALGRLVTTANERRADFFVVAGDLFDSTRVKVADIEKSVELLKGFSGEAVLIVPGKRALATGQSLKRIRETLNRVTGGGDDFLKDFADRVEQIFSQVTREQVKLEFDGSLPAQVKRGAVKLEPTRLSQGACGALALAIRLAMAEAYLKEAGGFIMFDDPLVHFDINRAAEAADIIRAFAERHQVIFFTCHDHHAARLKT